MSYFAFKTIAISLAWGMLHAKNSILFLLYFECKLFKEEEYIESGFGNTKKKAEQEASRNALIHYRVISK